MSQPIKATILTDKYIGKVLIAAKGTTITIYDDSREDVWLCLDSKNETFPCHKDLLKISG